MKPSQSTAARESRLFRSAWREASNAPRKARPATTCGQMRSSGSSQCIAGPTFMGQLPPTQALSGCPEGRVTRVPNFGKAESHESQSSGRPSYTTPNLRRDELHESQLSEGRVNSSDNLVKFGTRGTRPS